MKSLKYDAKVIFEAEIEPGDGMCYLVIFGKHVNGYFCCLPRLNIGAEMAEPADVFWNAGSLQEAGLTGKQAKAIAEAIREICKEN